MRGEGGYTGLAAKLDFAADVAPLVRLGHIDGGERQYTGLAAKLDFAADVTPLVRLGRHIDGRRGDTRGLRPNWTLALMCHH
jgi:hypothetical protein